MSRIMNTLCVAALVVATSDLGAQDAQSARSGFGMSLGLGNGSAGVTCEGCGDVEDERMDGLSGYLRMGRHISPQFFVGVEGTGWMKNSDGWERRIAAVSGVVLVYPSASAGFFVRGGAGAIRAVIEDASNSATGSGITWQAGLGYDLGLGGVALTPYVTYVESMEVALHINDVSTGFNLNPNILQFGLAVTVQ